MSKAIIIMDIPDSCDNCPLFGNHYSDLCCKALNNRSIDYPYPKDFRQEWCPLREIIDTPSINIIPFEVDYASYMKGWNDCIDRNLY